MAKIRKFFKKPLAVTLFSHNLNIGQVPCKENISDISVLFLHIIPYLILILPKVCIFASVKTFFRMKENKLLELLKKGEGINIEFKTCHEQISESLYETICSFLNHSGGHIILGINDGGEIVGVNPQKVETLKTNIITCLKNQELFLPCPYITPQIIETNKKFIILLDIPCGQYVYRYKGHYWDRNGDADIDITNQVELLFSLFERKNPHLFEDRIVDGLEIKDLDHNTFQYCRNILSVIKPEHAWLQLNDEEILTHSRLALYDTASNKIKLKYAALILFGKDDAIENFMPRYRFEALFHMYTYDDYINLNKFPTRYDDRRTIRCNLIKVYNQLSQFTERYLPDKFYLPEGTSQRMDIRWALFREIVANLCVHADYSSGYACFYHIFKDRVVTKNPTRLLPDIPEGKLSLQQLGNYTKNPLLTRIFHELSFVEDMGSGARNISRYAPLYYPDYIVEINNTSQFIFSITYMKMSPKTDENVTKIGKMSPKTDENVTKIGKMSPKNVASLDDEELKLNIDETFLDKKSTIKKRQRQQGIVGLIINNPNISIDDMAEKLCVNKRTILRDIEELKNVIEHIGPTRGGSWIGRQNK